MIVGLFRPSGIRNPGTLLSKEGLLHIAYVLRHGILKTGWRIAGLRKLHAMGHSISLHPDTANFNASSYIGPFFS